MKRSKHGNYHRVVALVLIAIVVISAIGFVVNGWQPIISSGADNSIADGNTKGDAEINDAPTNSTPVVSPPKYYSFLTGLETDEESSKTLPLAFLTDPDMPMYGVSSSSLAIEFPIEGGKSRLLIYSQKATELGKVGPLMPTRAYVSDFVTQFSGILLGVGIDDTVQYPSSVAESAFIDLSITSGFHYTEIENAYSNGDLIRAALSASNTSTNLSTPPRIPFSFTDTGATPRLFSDVATKIAIPHGEGSTTDLIYDEQSNAYVYHKNGEQAKDMLNASRVDFDNVMVLFYDTVTYETTSGTELIPQTVGSGSGYYLTKGTYTEIKWVSDGETLTFYDKSENKLVINRGRSYISIVKSTLADKVIFS